MISNPFDKDKAAQFQKAVAPRDENERRDWQAANKKLMGTKSDAV